MTVGGTWFVALAAGAAIAACSVSPDEERELGVELAASTDSQLPLLNDTIVTRFVTHVGRSLTSHTSRADLDWSFKVVNASAVNAFALPGGFIYVTRGLIEQADREDELAGVMGHEIGHVVLRHSIKQMEEAGKRDIAVILLCTLTKACSTVGGAIAVQVGSDAASAQYSQQDESAADSAAVTITARAGYDPEGLPAFLQRILAARTGQPSPIEAFFSTHPTDHTRITALERQIAARRTANGPALTRDTPEFGTMREHVKHLPPPPVDSTQQAVTLRGGL